MHMYMYPSDNLVPAGILATPTVMNVDWPSTKHFSCVRGAFIGQVFLSQTFQSLDSSLAEGDKSSF